MAGFSNDGRSGAPALAPAAADDKDWTWVLQRQCEECGVAVANLEVAQAARLLRASSDRYVEVLAQADVGRRPDAQTWSPLEYGAHVRDVHRTMAARVEAMLATSGTEPARFANWDQDATAIEQRYDLEDPDEVAAALRTAAEQVAALYAGVRPQDEARRGLRSNGSEFTVRTLAQYHLHDVLHHLHDVGADPRRLLDPEGAEPAAGVGGVGGVGGVSGVSGVSGVGGVSGVSGVSGVAMRETEFWQRMEAAIGPALVRHWSQTHVLTALGNRTVAEALAAGEDPKRIWAAVHEVLELPATQR